LLCQRTCLLPLLLWLCWREQTNVLLLRLRRTAVPTFVCPLLGVDDAHRDE
jgi:hypothetical protein